MVVPLPAPLREISRTLPHAIVEHQKKQWMCHINLDRFEDDVECSPVLTAPFMLHPGFPVIPASCPGPLSLCLMWSALSVQDAKLKDVGDERVSTLGEDPLADLLGEPMMCIYFNVPWLAWVEQDQRAW